ncbi:unnamed protein product [Lampetra fluviatilis]
MSEWVASATPGRLCLPSLDVYNCNQGFRPAIASWAQGSPVWSGAVNRRDTSKVVRRRGVRVGSAKRSRCPPRARASTTLGVDVRVARGERPRDQGVSPARKSGPGHHGDKMRRVFSRRGSRGCGVAPRCICARLHGSNDSAATATAARSPALGRPRPHLGDRSHPRRSSPSRAP